MWSRITPWTLRLTWAALPFTLGSIVAATLQREAPAVRASLSVALWGAWSLGVVASLVAHPVSLTVLRSLAPGAVVAAAACAARLGTGAHWATAESSAAAYAAGTAVIAFLPGVSRWALNGPAYPNERRFALTIPGPLILGPLPAAWAGLVGIPTLALVLLASRQWVAGAMVAAIGVPLCPLVGRAIHGLSRRWIVFVPAGIVLHDPMVLADPVLFPRETIARLSPAPVRANGTDLTRGAVGMVLELILTAPATVVTVSARRRPEPIETGRVLLAPSRPGEVLREAVHRRLNVVSAAAP